MPLRYYLEEPRPKQTINQQMSRNNGKFCQIQG